jgi:cysteinyl-tRNA synthetase
MVLKVYNTASRKKQIFKPIENGKVGMYVCGITPYDLSHVGHARSYVAFDVIRRSLEFLGFDVKYIQNFTDIDNILKNIFMIWTPWGLRGQTVIHVSQRG